MSARSSSVGPAPFFMTPTTPVPPTPVGDLRAGLAELGGHPLRRLGLDVGQFGVPVEMDEQRAEVRVVIGLHRRIEPVIGATPVPGN